MKKFVLACLILSGSSSLALAQSQAANPVTQQTTTNNELGLFSSKISEIDASLQRNNVTQAQKSAADLLALMNSQIEKNTKLMHASKDVKEQTALVAKIKHQTELAGQVKVLSTDVVKNKMEILARAKTFMTEL